MTTATATASPGRKRCSCCNRALPKTEEYFYKAKNSKTGLITRCKDCSREASRRSYHTIASRGRDHRTAVAQSYDPAINPSKGNLIPGYKRCANAYCCRVLPANDRFFPGDPTELDGLDRICRRCRAVETSKELTEKTPDAIIPY